jgi:hypothetical protein
MSKEEAVLRYKASMSVFKKWAVEGLINEEELLAIDTKLAEKYGVSLSSIYRENDLLCTPIRANIP